MVRHAMKKIHFFFDCIHSFRIVYSLIMVSTIHHRVLHIYLQFNIMTDNWKWVKRFNYGQSNNKWSIDHSATRSVCVCLYLFERARFCLKYNKRNETNEFSLSFTKPLVTAALSMYVFHFICICFLRMYICVCVCVLFFGVWFSFCSKLWYFLFFAIGFTL